MRNKKLFFIVFALLFLVCFCGFVYIFFSLDSKFSSSKDPFEDRYSKLLLDKDGEILSLFLNQTQQWHIKNPNPLQDRLKLSVITYEDKRFLEHFGIDFLAILRSIYINLAYSKKIGGSTISMQTIKLLTNNKRTISNKIKESILALRLESKFSKEEILEMYLNNAPYGSNIVGIASACKIYFDKSCSNLSWGESALLSVIPNSPNLLFSNPQKLLDKRDALLQRLHDLGYFDDDILHLSFAESLPSIHRFSNLAPHLAYRFKDKILHSNIDRELQATLESKLKAYHLKSKNLGVENLLALIVENNTSKVLAYGASQDFYDISGGGQIDGIISLRSPGSLLKPFLFAKSLDDGLISAHSKLVDIPTFFSSFKPQNANKKYYGLIDASLALSLSLNVPFVRLLEQYGYDRFFYDLKNMLDFDDENFERYGLSLILGTKEFSPESIAYLYAGLGNYGIFKSLCYLASCHQKEARYLSAGSSYLTLKALSENHNGALAIKTGTSYGRKDAWSAGVSPKYTIIVWLGNFNAQSNPNIYGASLATPLLLDIAHILDLKEEFIKPKDSLKEIRLDMFSSYRYSTRYIDTQSYIDEIPKDAALRLSPFLKNVFVNQKNEEVGSNSLAFKESTQITQISFPPALLAYYKDQNTNIKSTKTDLKILYPKPSIHIRKTRDFQGENKIIARIANASNSEVYWYLDDRFIGSSKAYIKELNLKSGTHTLSIINEFGSTHSVKFSVE